MYDIDRVFSKIKSNKQKRTDHYFNCIPFVGFDRLERYLPGIEKETYYIVTASSGIGKSKFTRSMFMHHPVNYVMDNPEADIKLKIFLFSLEESKEKVLLSEVSKYLWNHYGIRKNVKELKSVGRHNTISKDILNKIEEAKDYFHSLEEYLDIYDDIRRPDDIYSTVLAWLKRNGTCHYKEVEVMDFDGSFRSKTILDYYEPDHPNTYVIIIVDHIKLLQMMKPTHSTKHTINAWSSDYCLELRDKFGCTIVNVQQQAAQQESLDNFKLNKLEPSLNGLGEHKLTQQDANVVLGLFAPDRYELESHRGYNILALGDHYRSLSILKDRDGSPNLTLGLYFDGAADVFKEYPKSSQMGPIYDHLSVGGNLIEYFNETEETPPWED